MMGTIWRWIWPPAAFRHGLRKMIEREMRTPWPERRVLADQLLQHAKRPSFCCKFGLKFHH